jgi:hypothetical protein
VSIGKEKSFRLGNRELLTFSRGFPKSALDWLISPIVIRRKLRSLTRAIRVLVFVGFKPKEFVDTAEAFFAHS